jgi:hypothetical protein
MVVVEGFDTSIPLYISGGHWYDLIPVGFERRIEKT